MLKMVQNIMETGFRIRNTEWAFKFILYIFMMATGLLVQKMDKERQNLNADWIIKVPG